MWSRIESVLPPQIDHTKIDYPSDALTIKDLRKLSPRDFDVKDSVGGLIPEIPDEIGTMIQWERYLAGYAFDLALGRPIHEGPFARRTELVRDLQHFYTQFGLANDTKQARQLVLGLQAAAEQQARQLTPGPAR
jgi:hypothetical protein